VRKARAPARKSSVPPEQLQEAAVSRHLVSCWTEAVRDLEEGASAPVQLCNTDGDPQSPSLQRDAAAQQKPAPSPPPEARLAPDEAFDFGTIRREFGLEE
jgi:hypothetical protein